MKPRSAGFVDEVGIRGYPESILLVSLAYRHVVKVRGYNS
jgi:hypothetical protein